MKLIYKTMIIVLLIAGATMGCIEPSEKEYTTIWYGGTMSVEAYTPNGVLLHQQATPFEDEMPYTEYDWNDEMSMEEMCDLLGIQYTRIDTEYDNVDRPTSDKVVGKGRYTIHTDDGYFVLNVYYTATRY